MQELLVTLGVLGTCGLILQLYVAVVEDHFGR